MTVLNLSHMAAAAAALIAAGYLLLGTVALMPARRAIGLELIRTFFSATLIIAILVVLFLAGPLAMIPAMALLGLRIGYEAAHVRVGAGSTTNAVAVLTSALALAAMLVPMLALAMIGFWLLCLSRMVAVPQGEPSTPMSLLDLLIYPVLPFAVLAYGASNPELAAMMLAAYILVEVFDSCALLCGKLFGRTPAFPNLSPRKTIEGLAGGGAFLCLAALLAAMGLSLPFAGTVLTAIAVGVLAICGDLAASRLKRKGGVKDFPVVMARQGGVLDSLDSWIAAGAGLTAYHILTGLL